MKQRNKKSLKITDAVVRGDKDAYEFEVFPIETEFEPQSAVYIFSRRKVDRMSRGHQRFLCIGQTASLDGDFAKYKKQFASQFKANVICVRIEEEEALRIKIEEELKTAHHISCSTNIKPEPVKAEKIKAEKFRIPKLEVKPTEALQPKKPASAQKSLNLKAPVQPAPEIKLSAKKIKDDSKAATPNKEAKTKTSKNIEPVKSAPVVSLKPVKSPAPAVKAPASKYKSAVSFSAGKQKSPLPAAKISKTTAPVAVVKPKNQKETVKLAAAKGKKAPIVETKPLKTATVKAKRQALQPAAVTSTTKKPKAPLKQATQQPQPAARLPRSSKTSKTATKPELPVIKTKKQQLASKQELKTVKTKPGNKSSKQAESASPVKTTAVKAAAPVSKKAAKTLKTGEPKKVKETAPVSNKKAKATESAKPQPKLKQKPAQTPVKNKKGAAKSTSRKQLAF